MRGTFELPVFILLYRGFLFTGFWYDLVWKQILFTGRAKIHQNEFSSHVLHSANEGTFPGQKNPSFLRTNWFDDFQCVPWFQGFFAGAIIHTGHAPFCLAAAFYFNYRQILISLSPPCLIRLDAEISLFFCLWHSGSTSL